MTAIIVGAGSRGSIYASYALEQPDRLRIVGVVEPRDYFRARLAAAHGIPSCDATTDWRNEGESSSMLLQKSCHDLDLIRHIMGRSCRSVSSFGSLRHFKAEAKPSAAGRETRCLDCPHEPRCPYSAVRIYLSRLRSGEPGWPWDVVVPEPTEESLMAALREGPYGRCVYECDNDVVDNQVVSLLFDGGTTATFTMTAFCEAWHRRTRIFGTLGEIAGDGVSVEVFDFLTDQRRHLESVEAAGSLAGHGGGDGGVIEAFVMAVGTGNRDAILSGPEESLETHRIVFAAERARREHRVVDL